jgi:hypothetical protein
VATPPTTAAGSLEQAWAVQTIGNVQSGISGMTVGVGDLVIVNVTSEDTAYGVTAIADSLGNTWTEHFSNDAAGGSKPYVGLWSTIVTSGGTMNMTLTGTGTWTGAQTRWGGGRIRKYAVGDHGGIGAFATAAAASGAPSLTMSTTFANSALMVIDADWAALDGSARAFRQALETPVTGLTGVAATDVLTLAGHTLVNGDVGYFSALTGGTGLTATTQQYWVRDVSGSTFKVATTKGGTAVNFTTDVTAGGFVRNLREGTYASIVGVNGTTYSWTHLDVGAAGSKTVGLTTPATQNYTIVGLEIRSPDYVPPPVSLVLASATPAGVGAGTATATPLNLTYPAGILADDLIVVLVGMKPQSATFTTPAGYTALSNSSLAAGTGTTGVDTGQVKAAVFVKEAAGTETGTLAIALASSPSSAYGKILVFRKGDPLATWDYACANAGDTTTASPMAGTMNVNPGAIVDDMLVVNAVTPTDANTWATPTLTATGLTVTMVEDSEPKTSQGNDLGGQISYGTVTGGPASAAAAFSSTVTTGTINASGAMVLIRVRAVPPPSGVALDGNTAGTSSTAGSLTVLRPLGGTTAGTSTTSGTGTVLRPLGGTSAGTSTTAGDLTVARPLAGTTAGTSTTTGDAVAVRTLAGATAGTSTTAGDLVGVRTLAGTSAGTSATTGTLGVAQAAAGTSAGTSATTGDLTVARPLTGATAGTSTTTGALTVLRPLGGTTAGTSTTAGAVLVAWKLAAATAGTSSTAGDVVAARPLAGSSAGTSTTAGSLAGGFGIDATSAGTSTTAGDLSVARPLAGATAGTSTTAGTATVLRPLAGSSAGTSTTAGSLTVARPLAGSSAGTSTTAAATVVCDRPLSTTSAGTSTTAGSFPGSTSLTGTSAGTSSGTAELGVARALGGTSTGTSSSAGTVTVLRPLAGATAGASSTAGAILVGRALTATSSGTATTTGTVRVAWKLAATTIGTSTTTANLSLGTSSGVGHREPGPVGHRTGRVGHRAGVEVGARPGGRPGHRDADDVGHRP